MTLPGVTFADANAPPEDARFVILGVPFDRTSSFRAGARHAPNAIRAASYNFETFIFELGVDLLDVPFYDMGDLEEHGTVDDMVEEVHATVKDLVETGIFPVIMGGEHSITIPAVRAFEDIGVIIIDAHLDFRDEYLGVKNSHACVTRRVSEHVGLNGVSVFGVRSISKEEWEEDKPLYFDAFTIRSRGILNCINEALKRMGSQRIYLSLDIDGIDPSFAPGTGTPEPFGLDPVEVKALISAIGDRLVGFDIVEVCPPYDNGNTAALAARFIREVIATAYKHKR